MTPLAVSRQPWGQLGAAAKTLAQFAVLGSCSSPIDLGLF